MPHIAYRILLTELSQANKITQVLTVADQKHQVPKLLAPLKQFYYDVALPSLFEVADPTHALYGSDFPFAPSVAVGFMAKQYEGCSIDPAIRAGIDRDNAEKLFPRLA